MPVLKSIKNDYFSCYFLEKSEYYVRIITRMENTVVANSTTFSPWRWAGLHQVGAHDPARTLVLPGAILLI
jgi:hypothetical protein